MSFSTTYSLLPYIYPAVLDTPLVYYEKVVLTM
jgi:hypothetical protein